ncbi:uncharacterized protein METZ01_LOCUS517350, partial [marine metagenome]
RERNETSARHARLAFLLVRENLEKVFLEPGDVVARGFVQLGASHAGAAIENSMLGAAHSMANPLTARRGVVHGNAVGMSLPAVMRFNAELPEVRAIYAGLARDAGLAGADAEDAPASEAVIAQVEKLLHSAGFPLTLQEHGFAREEIAGLAAEAAGQWTAGFNPCPLTVADFEKLYAAIFTGSVCEETVTEACSQEG